MRVKKINPTPAQLSTREHAAMVFIEAYREAHWQSPTIRELAPVIGLSPSASHALVARLVEYGYLTRGKMTGRRVRGFRIIHSVHSSNDSLYTGR